MIRTRFAPSPTGRLHLGHAYSALLTWQAAHQNRGEFILRIEDIDKGRARPEYESGIFKDLAWLGLSWPEPVRRQSEHFDTYRDALNTLQNKGLLYPCFCTRKDIKAEIERSASAPHGPEGALYPGTCRGLSRADIAAAKADGKPYALRLDMAAALSGAQGETPLIWRDRGKGDQTATPGILGDVVLARKDVPASYHLCVTLDDHLQGITLVTRGEDLFYATHLHRLLQALLALDVPEWHHHGLLLDEDGKRFAKRNQSVTLQYMREEESRSAEDIRRLIQDKGGFFTDHADFT